MLVFIPDDIKNKINTFVHILPLNSKFKISTELIVKQWFKHLGIEFKDIESGQLNLIYKFYFQHSFISINGRSFWKIILYDTFTGNDKRGSSINEHMINGLNYKPLVIKIINDSNINDSNWQRNNDLSSFAFNCYKYKQLNWIEVIKSNLIIPKPCQCWNKYFRISYLIDFNFKDLKLISQNLYQHEWLIVLNYKVWDEKEQYELYCHMCYEHSLRLFSLEFIYKIYCLTPYLFSKLLNNGTLIIRILFEIQKLDSKFVILNSKILNDIDFCYRWIPEAAHNLYLCTKTWKIIADIKDSLVFNPQKYKDFIQELSIKYDIDLLPIFNSYLEI